MQEELEVEDGVGITGDGEKRGKISNASIVLNSFILLLFGTNSVTPTLIGEQVVLGYNSLLRILFSGFSFHYGEIA